MIECAWCGRKYKTEKGYHAHIKAKHPEPEPSKVNPNEIRQDPQMNLLLQETVTPEPKTNPLNGDIEVLAESPGSERLQAPADNLPTDDQVIAAILGDPIGGPLMQMVQHLNTEQQTFKQDIIGALTDVNNSIEYLKAVPAGEHDYVASFDKFVERWGIGDAIADTVKRLPDILDRLSGGDPIQSELGSDFMADAKAAYMREKNNEAEAMELMKAALGRGETILTLSPEDLEKARAEGLIDEP